MVSVNIRDELCAKLGCCLSPISWREKWSIPQFQGSRWLSSASFRNPCEERSSPRSNLSLGIAYLVHLLWDICVITVIKMEINNLHLACMHSSRVNPPGPPAIFVYPDRHRMHLSQVPLNSTPFTKWKCLSRLSMCVIEIIENWSVSSQSSLGK